MLRFAALASLTLAALSASRAADELPAVAPLELRDAVAAMLGAHPEFEAARHRLDAARARADAAAQPLYNPELEVEREHGDDDTISAGLSLAIDWSRKRHARAAVGTANEAVAMAELAVTRTRLTLEWLKAWAAWQVASTRVALGRERIALMQRFAELGEKQLRVGDISRLERDLALLAESQARAEHGDLLAEQAEALRTLQSGSATAIATAQLPSLPALPPESLQAEPRTTDVPELAKARADTTAARARITVAERERRPDPTVAVRTGRVDLGAESEPLIGVVLSIPLPVRNAMRAEVVAAQADASEAESQERAVEAKAHASAMEAVAVYRALRRIWLDPAAAAAASAAERADLLDRLWTAGEISTADYLTQLKQSIDTELAREALRQRLWQAWFEHLAAAGQLEAWLDGSLSAGTRPP